MVEIYPPLGKILNQPKEGNQQKVAVKLEDVAENYVLSKVRKELRFVFIEKNTPVIKMLNAKDKQTANAPGLKRTN